MIRKTKKHRKWIKYLSEYYLTEGYYYDIKKHTTWIGWQAGNKTSMSTAVVYPEEDLCYLSAMVVLPEYRGKGLQRQHIRTRVKWAKCQNISQVITCTHKYTHASSNNLIREGFELYEPDWRWAGPDYLYWSKSI